MMRLLRMCGVAGVGVAGWLGGRSYEQIRWDRQKKEEEEGWEEERPIFPRFPAFGVSVSAATAVTSSGERSLVPVEGGGVKTVPPEPVGAPRVAQIMRFGFPGLDNIRSHSDYILSYDRRNRVPHWVFEHLTKESVRRSEGVDRSNCEFKEDPSVHPFFRSKNSDYKYSGYDRGHLAPAGNHRMDQAMCNETFYLSNMCPQVGRGFNRDKWEHLERYVRGMTKLYKNVYVCTGPLYLPKREGDGKMYIKYEVIGDSNVSVPTHFFKVVVGETDNHHLDMEAYVLPNQVIPDDTPLDNFRVPVDSVERAAGLLFFDRLSRDKLSRINGQKTGWF